MVVALVKSHAQIAVVAIVFVITINSRKEADQRPVRFLARPPPGRKERGRDFDFDLELEMLPSGTTTAAFFVVALRHWASGKA